MSKRHGGKKRGRAVKRVDGTADGAIRPRDCYQCGRKDCAPLCWQCKEVCEKAEERARREGR